MKFITLILPMILGFIIDFILGDPYWFPHPIRAIGNFISVMEKLIRRHMPSKLRAGGVILGLTTIFFSTSIPLIILLFSYRYNILIGLLIESIMCYYIICPKCLKNESMKVYVTIAQKNIEKARKAVSMIVGRDTENLDKSGIIRATVETVAENTSDGVTAPLMYISVLGAVGGFFYKAVNTMDSMIGYTNEKYADIGRFAAKSDDFLNFVPSRITAVLMIFSAKILGLDSKNALKIWRRDRRNHASPNSAQTEAVCAGALGIRLAGDAYYFGELHKKPFIGDNKRSIENEDIMRINKLMYMTSFLTLILGAVFRMVIWGAIL
ncbi:MAG: adenosylcobinamide-phosphate synthase CbiB [Ruminococcus sp.]|nr:adenosylcobinamide-phosphate synthase CbiB [Ruminococcus sp.]